MIDEILASYKDPFLHEDYVSLGAVRLLEPAAGVPQVEITLPYPVAKVTKRLKAELSAHFLQQSPQLSPPPAFRFKQEITAISPRPQKLQPASRLGQVRNIIAVASGKGGVGKSTTALYLSRALQLLGVKVGLLDADIYGPSLPYLLKSTALPAGHSLAAEDKSLNPVDAAGIKNISLAYLLAGEQTPAIWRGAMASNALQQLVFSTNWGELDYLIIDLPPGTGDIQLTLCQRVSLSAALIVTTPHQLAVMGAQKGLEMFRKLYVPVLGVIENMSYYICPSCGAKHYLFGKDKSRVLYEHAAKLAEIPLAADYNDDISATELPEFWQDLAFDICLRLSKLGIPKVPEIRVVND